MKTLRRIFFILFIFTALISADMFYNLFRGRAISAMLLSEAEIPLVYVAVQLVGLIVVIFSRNRILAGIFSILTGIATMLSGFLAFGFVGAPAPQTLAIISLMTMGVSYFVFVGYAILGGLFFVKKPDKEKK